MAREVPTQRKVPRGRGYDKRAIKKRLKALEGFTGSIQQFARQEKLQANALVVACEDHFSERWQQYIASHPLEESTCAYCTKTFIPNRTNQEYCDDQCSAHGRTDRNYFGGKRREAVGMSDGVCQLCGQSPKKGLTPHHLIGKENDPDNDHMIALCLGCHHLVTDASRRLFLREPEGWERLQRLVEIRVAGVVDDKPFRW